MKTVLINSNRVLLSLGCLLTVFFLSAGADTTLAATYTADRTETTNGGSSWGKEILLFEASIDGADATFTVSNVDSNATIPSDGMMFLKSGDTFRATEECDDSETIMSKDVDPDTPSVKFYPNLDAVSDTYPVTFYVCYRNWLPGVTAWAGPITVSSAPEVSGSITSPQDGATLQGDFTVSCNASAPAGLKEVSLFLGTDNYDSPIELCKDGTASSCSGTSKSWNDYNIDPTQYGVTSSDTFKLLLTVRDEDGNLDYVDYHEVTWSPAPPSSSGATGLITSPGNTAEGDFTVSAKAQDPAGLEKVSVVFSSGGTLVLCEDGTSKSCSGTSDSWSKSVTPADYGMTDAGTYTLSLWVSNEDGDSPERVDTQTVNWSPNVPPSSGVTGSITSPGSTAEGNFTVSCNAAASAGLHEVSVYFGNNNLPVVMCKDGTSTPCPSTSGSWTETNVNPLDHGVSGAGDIKMGLYVKDDDGNFDLVDIHPVTWSPGVPSPNTPPSGNFSSPSGLVNGLVTVRASASDADGLKKVSVVFVPDGFPLVLCDDTTSTPCTTGPWEAVGINPADYGAVAGNIILGLHVQDELDGNTETLAAKD